MKITILKIACLFSSCFLFSIAVSAQKPAIDTNILNRRWASVGNINITDDGNYVTYNIRHAAPGSPSFFVQAIHNKWKMDESTGSEPYFSKDSKKLIFTKNDDTIEIVTLGTGQKQYISDAYALGAINCGIQTFIAFKKKGRDDQLVMRDLKSGTERTFSGVKDYQFSNNNRILLLTTNVNPEQSNQFCLEWVSLPDFNRKIVYHGQEPANLIFDKTNHQVCFNANTDKGNVLWYYNEENNQAEKLVNVNSEGISNDRSVGSPIQFSYDGQSIFFSLHSSNNVLPVPKHAVVVDVWSYNDTRLQSSQLLKAKSRTYCAIVHISEHRVIPLESENDQILSLRSPERFKDDYLIITHLNGDNEAYWNRNAQPDYFLVSTRDGKRTPLDELFNNRQSSNIPILSPKNDYIIYYDGLKRNYFSYNVATGSYKNLTEGVAANWNLRTDIRGEKLVGVGVAGFINKGSEVLIYDQNDLFQISLSGKHSPINLTNGYGRKNNIVFRLAFSNSDSVINPRERILLNAFNRENKDNGFYSISAGISRDPQILTMQSRVIEGNDELGDYDEGGMTPLKATGANIYIVQKQDSNDAPNFYWTNDFKTYTQITNIQPQRFYNWLTTALVTWKTFDGTNAQGVLYKPENFDPQKKYPLIIFYYEHLSAGLHLFLPPSWSDATIDIPYYVSNGYLIFTPAIQFPLETGQGPGAYNTIVSAAKYLSGMAWVDNKRIGINGHSRGGFETDYLITHTNVFAAAISASGYCDAVGLYGRINSDGESGEPAYEFGHQRIGATLWERPDLYIENSPVLQANKVTTPVLMMNNMMDGEIPWAQGVEFFTSLRRLGKRAWMLQYDGEGHVLERLDAKKDFTIRMKQFFDHYLKEAPAPKWMVEGIPAAEKGIDDGLELEPPGVEPGRGLLNDDEQKKLDSLETRQPMTIKIP